MGSGGNPAYSVEGQRLYGDGRAAERIVKTLLSKLKEE